ncbi:MAG TPA: hypothetical protein VGC85_03055 [Chthoniobacterales bacterium]
MKTLCALIIGIVVASLCYRHFNAPIEHEPGVLVATEPQQGLLPADTDVIEHGAFHLKPLATFSIDARLLHSKHYGYDRQAALAPVDLAVGWGAMSDSAVLAQLNISQSMRFYWYEYRLPPPIAPDEIVTHSTNLHIIPADAQIEKACRSFRRGELIHLEGELVEATGPSINGPWRSSLRRDDTGNGACELFYVEHVSKIDADGVTPGQRLVRR